MGSARASIWIVPFVLLWAGCEMVYSPFDPIKDAGVDTRPDWTSDGTDATPPEDRDGDGWTTEEGDCVDWNPLVNPRA